MTAERDELAERRHAVMAQLLDAIATAAKNQRGNNAADFAQAFDTLRGPLPGAVKRVR